MKKTEKRIPHCLVRCKRAVFMLPVFFVICCLCINHVFAGDFKYGPVGSQRMGMLSAIQQTPSMDETIIGYFKKLLPQDKIYLHTDKPYYGAGDSIRFAGYLVNAATLQDSSLTNFIYVELADRRDSVVVRQKIRRDSIGFHGTIILPVRLMPGEYYLRGYSRWMLNFDSTFVFSKNVYIDNPVADYVRSKINYTRTASGILQAKIRFNSETGKVLSGVKVRYTFSGPDGKIRKDGNIRTGLSGEVEIPVPGKMEEIPNGFLRVDFEDKTYIYKNLYYLPREGRDYSVTFFPEGGNLIDNVPCRIAFKAQSETGFGQDIRGYVANSSGDSIAPIETEHDGMGSFDLLPSSAEQYTVHTVSPEGEKKTFPLPAVESEGVSLRLDNDVAAQKLHYRIDGQGNQAGLRLVGHTQGVPFLLETIHDENLSGTVPTTELTPGIAHLLVTNVQGKVLSERLIFIDPAPTTWKMQTDKAEYGVREKVEVDLEIPDEYLDGRYSVSITDNHSVAYDPDADNIVSSLLLTGDLSGYIDRPGYYFTASGPERDRRLDLVMLTHGWRRHHIDNFTKEPNPPVNFYVEQSQFIEGKIKNIWGKDAKEAKIKLLGLGEGIFEFATTDENGCFRIDHLDYQDTAQFKIQGRTKNNYTGVDVLVERDTFEKVFNPIPYRRDSIRREQLEEYNAKTRDNYILAGGLEVTNLKEAVVEAPRIFRDRPMHIRRYGKVINADFIKAKPYAKNAFELARSMPGMNGTARTLDGKPLIVVDGEEQGATDTSILESIPRDNVEMMAIISTEDLLVMEGSIPFKTADPYNMVIFVFLKNPQQLGFKAGLESFTSLGYTTDTEFYHPVYDTPDKRNFQRPDRRTTLYWNPAVIPGEDGRIRLSFYTSDAEPDYTFVLEGLEPDGTVRRFTKQFPAK